MSYFHTESVFLLFWRTSSKMARFTFRESTFHFAVDVPGLIGLDIDEKFVVARSTGQAKLVTVGKYCTL